jgi:hypothetical protein
VGILAGIVTPPTGANVNNRRSDWESIFRRKIVSAIADIEYRMMLQSLSMFQLPHGNAAFGERRLPEHAPLGLIERLVPNPPVIGVAVDRRLFTFAPVGGGCNTTSVNGFKKIDSYCRPCRC